MHMSQQVSGSYPGASRDQFPPSAPQASSSVHGISAEMQLSPRAGRVGSPVVKRMSPSGVPTYYYYYAPSATSSPISRSSAVSTPPPAMSPVASGPHSPNFQHHHRQLPAAPTPSSPFHFPQPHQQQYYGTMTSAVEEQHHGPVHPQHHSPVPQHHSSSSLHHHYGVHPALLQQSHCFFSPPASPSPPRTPPPSHPMVQHPQRMVQTPCPSPSIGHRQVTVPQAHQQSQRTTTRTTTASGTSAVAIDNKIEQAMDLVKSHLMFAVREEVEVLKEKIAELMERINQLEAENSILKANASTETLAQLGGGGQAQAS